MLTAKKFKEDYLYFGRQYIGTSLYNFIDLYKDLELSLKTILPYMVPEDTCDFLNYIINTSIEYSNRMTLKLNKLLVINYLNTLTDERIKVDVVRLNFTKKFITGCGGKVKKYSKAYVIDTSGLNYINGEEIVMHNYCQISNKRRFLRNIMYSHRYFKYLLHQDIHNSIINPLLISIMLAKYHRNSGGSKVEPVWIQLRDITQIYEDINARKNKIVMYYFIKKFFIVDGNVSPHPIEKSIRPYLMIKIEMEIKEDDVYISLTF